MKIKTINIKDLGKKNIFCRSVAETPKQVCDAVDGIIKAVIAEGDSALLRFTEKFDGVKLDKIEIDQAELDAADAEKEVDGALLAALKTAAENIREFHAKQKREGFEFKRPDGAVLGQRFTPIERAGVYIPGGTARYPSTVLMDVIPAKIAGVKEIVMTTPPGKDGKIPAATLAAAKIAGVDRVFAIGGAQAIAALAYGTQSVPKVDKIVGPGNAYVTEAKRRVFGLVGLDMLAGPSEILIIADGSADPDFIAADMLSQAEHDKNASAVLICETETFAQKVVKRLEIRLETLTRREIAAQSLENNGMIIIAGLDEAIRISDSLSPEHLELCVSDPEAALAKVKNAGSIFLGHYTPEALGDYLAGTNHTLPTMGTARFSSPLSVDDFIKKSSYIRYDADSLSGVSGKIVDFARAEGLDAHAESVLARFEGQKV